MNNNELAYHIWVSIASDKPNQIKSSSQYNIEKILDRIYPEKKHKLFKDLKI